MSGRNLLEIAPARSHPSPRWGGWPGACCRPGGVMAQALKVPPTRRGNRAGFAELGPHRPPQFGGGMEPAALLVELVGRHSHG